MTFLNQLRQDNVEDQAPTISCHSTSSLKTVIEKLYATKIHRLFVADDQTNYSPTKVVSLTDILRFMIKS